MLPAPPPRARGEIWDKVRLGAQRGGHWGGRQARGHGGEDHGEGDRRGVCCEWAGDRNKMGVNRGGQG